MTTYTWQTVAVVDPEYMDRGQHIQEAIDLGNGVILGSIPSCIMHFGHLIGEKYLALRKATLAFVVEYTAEMSAEPKPDERIREPLEKQDEALNRIKNANLAVWLAHPSRLGCFLAFHAVQISDGSWLPTRFFTPQSFISNVRDLDAELTLNDFGLAHKLNAAIGDLSPDSSLTMATHAVVTALTVPFSPARLAFFWIALEALFGPDDPREITYRISQRIGLFLCPTDRARAKQIYEKVKKGYRLRSKVMHGLRLAKISSEQWEELMHETENLVRDGLVQILSDPDLIEVFTGDQREIYLDGLAFAT